MKKISQVRVPTPDITPMELFANGKALTEVVLVVN